MPSIDFQMQARKDYDVGGKSGVSTNITGQFIGSFNVFNGGRDIGKRRELRAKMASAKYSKRKELRRAEKEVRVSYAELISARSQSQALKGAVKSKKAVRDIYMKQFDAGTRNFIDILDASHEYFLAKGSLITSDATEDLSSARLLASIGILLEQFSGEIRHIPDRVKDDKGAELQFVSLKDEQNIAKAPNKDIKENVKQKGQTAVPERSEASVEPHNVRDNASADQERDLAQAAPNMSGTY
jgi:hypothetical protein